MIVNRTWRYLLSLVAVGVLVTACGDDDSESLDVENDIESSEAEGSASQGANGEASGVDLDALYEAAQEEGTVIAYTAAADSAFQAVADGFVEQYPGIDVEFIRLNSAAIAQRFGAERDSGAPTADLIGPHGAVDFHLANLEDGWIVPIDELPLPEGFPSDFMDPQLGPVYGYPLPVLIYNTDLVDEDEVPASWEALADPKWRGQVLMADLDEQDWHVGVYGTVIEEFGEEWAEGFVANEPRVVSGGVAPITELIAAGEAALAPIGYAPIAESIKGSGAPLDYTIPDPQTSVPSMLAINSEAENPNAARLFFHYMHTEDGVERGTLFGTHAPYQTDRDYEWVADDLRWATDADYFEKISGLLGQ